MEIMTYDAEKKKELAKEEHENEDTKPESAFFKSSSLTNLVPGSLLALLDDKNKSILLLKRQIHNQKLQLGFYLNKVLNGPQIMQLADSCMPYEAEENIHVNLAMNRFCKQTGLKSTLMNLHERMIGMEKHILNVAQQQEEMVHGIVTKIAEFAKHDATECNNPQVFLSKINGNDEKVDNLVKILGSTIKLRKELDIFRTCCNRLVLIEDERNSLVDQVYSMPVSKRLSYGVLLAAQYEKIRLEKEISEMQRENKLLQDRLANSISPNVPQLVDAYTSAEALPAPKPNNVDTMLEVVNTDAVSILNISKDKKDKYLEEIARLKEFNNQLQMQVTLLQNVELEKDSLEMRLVEAQGELEKVIRESDKDVTKIRQALTSMEGEKEFLQNKLIYYYDLEDQLQYMRSSIEDVNLLKKQRDYYKDQVEDLEAIRTAYIELMDNCGVTREDDGDKKQANDLLQRVRDLEVEREKMVAETGNLGNVIVDQQTQIKELLMIIQEIAKYGENADVPKASSFTQTKKSYAKTSGRFAPTTDGQSEQNNSGYSQTNEDSQLKNLLKNLPENENHTQVVFSNNKLSDDSEEKLGANLDKGNSVAVQSALPLISSVSVEVQTMNNKGVVEGVKAQLESTSTVEGFIKVSDSVSLRVTCTPPNNNNNDNSCTSNRQIVKNTTSTLACISSEKEIHSSNLSGRQVLDDFELMKDSSNEVLAGTLPTIHQRVENVVTTVQCIKESMHNINRKRSEERMTQSLHRSSVSNMTRKETPKTEASEKPPEVRNYYIGDRKENVKPAKSCNSTRSDISFQESDATDLPDHFIGEDGDLGVGVSITSRLQKLTSSLQCTLAKPGGKDSLVNAVIDMYSTLFTKTN